MIGIHSVERSEIKSLLFSSEQSNISKNEAKAIDACVLISQKIYVGAVDGQIACMWGLITPSMLSNQVYLWLYTTPLVNEHKFLFVRYSQRWVEGLFDEYETIVGHVMEGNHSAKRWIQWLGGRFTKKEDGKLIFEIKRRLNG